MSAPISEWIPSSAEELSRLMSENYNGQRVTLMPVGGRTSLKYGGAVVGNPLEVSTEKLNRVVDYPARDMTITVEAGMTISQLQEILSVEKQQLPIDIAQSGKATLAGAIAANASGPSRFGYGTFRDYVIGISAIDGQGRLYSAGGRVVKNVAGYDLCKLLIGSLGTLGIITQVTLKLVPQPQSKSFVVLPSQTTAEIQAVLAKLNTSATRPVILDLLNRQAAQQMFQGANSELPAGAFLLCVGFAGSAAETDWQARTVTEEMASCHGSTPIQVTGERAATLGNSLTEFQALSEPSLTFQASLLPSNVSSFVDQCTQAGLSVQAHAGSGTVVAHFPETITSSNPVAATVNSLRAAAQVSKGSLVILGGQKAGDPEITTFGDSLKGETLMRQLKQTFDPAGLLNPGRFW
ncbi:FAD-binding oxidoreductase [Planctomicrobium sp. SH668]|uniref:FAD-binding oxidoreductase n=1 Tax=Planctomicrobium sp. SH668 TaxID=3448126 RepID=UPI003F5AE3B0